MRNESKPWAGEFPSDRAEDMDDAAVEILIATMNAGRGPARQYGLVLPIVGTSMYKWAARDGHAPTYFVSPVTAGWPSIDAAKAAAAALYPDRTDVYPAEIGHLVRVG